MRLLGRTCPGTALAYAEMIVLKVMMSGLTPRANIAFSTSSAFPGRAGLQFAKAVITVEYLDKGAADSYGTTTSFKAVRCHSCVRACVRACQPDEGQRGLTRWYRAARRATPAWS